MSLTKAKPPVKPKSLSPVTFAHVKTKLGKSKPSRVGLIRVLFDSGCSASIVRQDVVQHLRIKDDPTTTWTTK